MIKVLLASVVAFLAGVAGTSAYSTTVTPGSPGPSMSVHPAPAEAGKPLGAEETRKLEALGAKIFGVKWSGKVTGVTARGFEALTDGNVTLSHRPSGNAWFVQNPKARTGPSFEGPDDQLIGRGKEILRGLGVDVSEIAEARVLQQYVSAGIVDPKSKQMKTDGPKKDRRTLLITRTIRDVPVWSSRLVLDLDREGRIALLEISWPKIKPETMEVSVTLSRSVGAYRAPEKPGAKVESVEAGILHSPAAAFLDDQVAAVRVVYAPINPRLGMKPVYYLGADGKPVAMPRQMDIREAPAPQRPGKPSHG